MRTGSSDLTHALQAGDRTYDLQVRLGGRDVTDEVAEWSIDRGIDTGLPDEVAVPTGSTAAAASVTLVGDDETTAAARYSPWAPRRTADIARPGQSAVVEWGLSEERMQSLRGRTTEISVQSRSGQAAVEALDGSELLRGRAWLPPVVQAAGGGPRTHTQWVVDHALRESGIYCSPPAREDSILFASMNGSREANYGIRVSETGVVGYHPSVSPWAAGPTTVLGGQPTRSWWTTTYAPQRRVMSQSNQLLVEWWLYCPAPGDGPQSEVRLTFANNPPGLSDRETRLIDLSYDPATRRLRASVGNAAVTWEAPTSSNQQGRFKVLFLVGLGSTSSPTSVRGWLYQPNGALYTSPSNWSGPAPFWSSLESVRVSAQGPVECVGVSRVSGNIELVQGWRRGADLDLIPPAGTTAGQPRYGLYGLPEVSGTWWDLLKEISQDTLSYMWFDEDGVFRMRRYEYVTPGSNPEPDVTVSAVRELADIDASEEIRSVANRVQVGWTEYDASAAYTERHTYSRIVEITAGGTEEFRVAFTERPWHLTAPQLFRGQTLPQDSAGSVIKFMGPGNVLSSVETEIRFDSGIPTFYFHNRSTHATRSVVTYGSDDQSFYTVYREASDAAGPLLTRLNSASINRYGSHSLEIGASPWVQADAWADLIATRLLQWTAWPLPRSSAVQVLPDPRIQVGDVVRLIDPTGTSINGVYRVLGYTVSGSGAAVTQTLDVRPLDRPDLPEDAGLDTEPVLHPGAESFPG